MSFQVIEVAETFDTRSIRVSTDRTRDYVRTFNVLVSHREISPDMVLTAIGIPRRWDFYVSAAGTFDPWSICTDVEAKQDPVDPYLWRVTARYSNKAERQDTNQNENPLLRPAEISYDTIEVKKPAWFDRDGQPIESSAGERFDPPLEYEELRLQITIVKNHPIYDALGTLAFQNRVNSHPWFGLPAGRVWCRKIKAKRSFESGILFWPTTYEFVVRVWLDENDQGLTDATSNEDAWAERVIDRGYVELVGDPEKPVHMRDFRTGQPVSTPQLLDGEGGRLAYGSDPVFLKFHLKKQANFNLLGLF